jgi:hypothetical protein
VYPNKAEAHALPFPRGFFDAVVSVDAYQYFGTDGLYVDYLSSFVRPGGLPGVVVVGLMREMGSVPPTHLSEAQSNGAADGCRRRGPLRSRPGTQSGRGPVTIGRRSQGGIRIADLATSNTG